MKVFEMIHFAEWVASVGGRAKAAEQMAVDPAQINRWTDAGAVITRDGTQYTPTPAKHKKPSIDAPD